MTLQSIVAHPARVRPRRCLTPSGIHLFPFTTPTSMLRVRAWTTAHLPHPAPTSTSIPAHCHLSALHPKTGPGALAGTPSLPSALIVVVTVSEEEATVRMPTLTVRLRLVDARARLTPGPPLLQRPPPVLHMEGKTGPYTVPALRGLTKSASEALLGAATLSVAQLALARRVEAGGM